MNEHTEIQDWVDFSKGKRDGIIVDVDGTLADMNGVRTPFEWNKVNKDKRCFEVFLSAIVWGDPPRVLLVFSVSTLSTPVNPN